MTDAADVTVVVPTRDRPVALRACLQSLAALDPRPADVVVVDDGSRDADAVRAVAEASWLAVTLLRAGGDGPAAARNRGALAAATPVVCFTDDDCRPDPGWLDALISTGDQAVIAGPTWCGADATTSALAAQTVTNHLVTTSLDPSAGTVGFAPTSNLAVRADVIRAHPFDEGFPLAAGEDREWCDRVRTAGHPIAFRDEAIVRHHPQLGLRGFWRQQVRYGRGAHRYRAAAASAARPAPGWYLEELVRTGFGQGARVGALVLLAQLATAVGYAREAVAARRQP